MSEARAYQKTHGCTPDLGGASLGSRASRPQPVQLDRGSRKLAPILNRTQTHPWIDFRPDSGQTDSSFWIQLGRAQAKCEQVAGVPLLPEIADQLHQIYLAKGALATTAIEGNTLSEEEAQKQIQGKLELPPSKEYLGQAIDNIVNACSAIADNIMLSEGPHELTVDGIKRLNRIVLYNLPLDDDIHPGQIRQDSVIVGRYRAAPAQDCEYLLARLCHWLNSEPFLPNESVKIASGILKAILAHLYIAWIHPFGDGNGRTARLVEFQLLLSSGVPTVAAHLLSNHYNQTRDQYYRMLDAASRSGGDVVPFVKYALQGFVDGLNEQILFIKAQQFHVHWINHVHALFRDRDSKTDARRRRLVIDLSEKSDPGADLGITSHLPSDRRSLRQRIRQDNSQ